MKIFGFISIFAAAALTAHLTLSYYNFVHSSPETKLKLLWERDVKHLSDNQLLPKEWNQISEITYVTPTDLSKDWIKNIEAPIRLNKNGLYELEIIITDWTENNKVSAVIQYILTDKKTKNLIWEFGRTFAIGQFNKEK